MSSTSHSVDHICTYTFGGAANAARRLHEGLRELGTDSRYWHRDETHSAVDDPSYLPLKFRPGTTNALAGPVVKTIKRFQRRVARHDHRNHLTNRPTGYEVFSPVSLFYDTYLSPNTLTGAIAHLHWIAFFVDYATFFASIPVQKPIVWTLHDMNPFTGGCHYASGCEAFAHGCGQCPQIRAAGKDDVSRRSYRLKRKLLKGRNLTVVTPSRWLNREAQRSLVFPSRTRFEVIPYGLETDLYRPVDIATARSELGIPRDAMVIAFGAEDLNNQRKGMSFLFEALPSVESSRPIHALVFGEGKLPEDRLNLAGVHSVGFVKDIATKAKVYSAADMFVMPSLEDNQPQTGLEAMACGTPVIAFDSGGIPEYVRSGLTGLLARVGDAKDLARQISWMLQHDAARDDMARHARQMIEAEFPLSLQARRYVKLYDELLYGSTSSRAA